MSSKSSLTQPRIFTTVALAVALNLASGCSGSSSRPSAPTGPLDGSALDAEFDAGPSAGLDAESAPDGASASGLAGTIVDKFGVPVNSAKIEAAGATGYSATDGTYALPGLAAGPTTLTITRDWFNPMQEPVTIDAAGVTKHDVTLEEIPLKLDPADQALAENYNMTFDWTTSTLSIAVVSQPTRNLFDNAVYYHNPALYRDVSAQAPLAPSPLPDIGSSGATGFTFPIRSGSNQGQEALVVASIADAITGTPLGATEPADFMMWTPMINWLMDWDAAKTVDLRAVGVAVRQQLWGGTALRPQDMDKVFIDAATGKLWVKVVFEPFVQVGAGISDDDGDGRKEIYAEVADANYTAEMVDKLRNDYIVKTFSTFGLSKEVTRGLNELYSTTAAQVEARIGQPFDLPGLGTINYPFLLLHYSTGQRNVILVAPSP
jgi:hypothetical protein